MLEHIFGSKVRVKLLKLFLGSNNDEQEYYIRELARTLGEHLNSVRRELENLEDVGLVVSQEKDKRKYYSVNKDFLLVPELKTLLLKSRELGEQKLVGQLEKVGTMDLLVLAGSFVGQAASPVDVFIVGRVQKNKLEALLKSHLKESGRDLKYTVMNKKEFQHRVDLGDRFIFTLLNGRKIVVINKLGV
ncbi:MAG: winged helix-turn-helix transcriptional regulator [Parcubacteria group bacterium]|nr:winged helix-turn-helix transcriptional regulator [Parcubacteria group bacterium]